MVVAAALTASTTPPVDAAAPSCGPTVRKSDGTAWRCSFSDDFTGSSLNRANWQPVTTATSGYHIGSDCYLDSPTSIAVGSGTLKLTTRRTTRPFTCSSPSGSYSSSYTSASLSSLGRYSQTYGRYEIRATFPATRTAGTHSAWWLWPESYSYGGWPWSGEIDIAEFYSQHADRAIPQVHYVPQQDQGIGARSSYWCLMKNPSQFHTYTLEWTRTRLVVQYDGATCLDLALQPAVSQAGTPLAAGQPFDQPFTLALTQGIGAEGNAPTAGTTLPATMEVDYVRVWS